MLADGPLREHAGTMDLHTLSPLVVALLLGAGWLRASRRVRLLERRDLRMQLGCSLLASTRGRQRDASRLALDALQRARDRGDAAHEGLAHECLGDIAQAAGDAAIARHHWCVAALVLQTWSCHADAARVCEKLARLSVCREDSARWEGRAAMLRHAARREGPTLRN